MKAHPKAAKALRLLGEAERLLRDEIKAPDDDWAKLAEAVRKAKVKLSPRLARFTIALHLAFGVSILYAIHRPASDRVFVSRSEKGPIVIPIGRLIVKSGLLRGSD